MSDALRILMLHRQHSAVGYYRTFLPARLLRSLGHEVKTFDNAPFFKTLRPRRSKGYQTPDPRYHGFEDFVRSNVGYYDLIISDRWADPDGLGLIAGLKHLTPQARLLVDFDDDFTSVPWWNSSHREFLPGSTFREIGLQHLRLAEGTLVSTPTLEDRFRPLSHWIRHAPNMIDPSDWEGHPVNPDRGGDPHLRILYGGANGHYGDLDEIRVALEALIENPPVPFRLICFGAKPEWLHEAARRHPTRVLDLPWIDFSDYPSVVAWGGFDLAIAPLAEHPFNEAKSNIKWLEASLQRIPFLCSDVGPYKAEIPSGCAIKVGNTPVQWLESLREVLRDAALRKRLTDRAYEAVHDSYTLDHRKSLWQNVIGEAVSLRRITTLEDTKLPSDF